LLAANCSYEFVVISYNPPANSNPGFFLGELKYLYG